MPRTKPARWSKPPGTSQGASKPVSNSMSSNTTPTPPSPPKPNPPMHAEPGSTSPQMAQSEEASTATDPPQASYLDVYASMQSCLQKNELPQAAEAAKEYLRVAKDGDEEFPQHSQRANQILSICSHKSTGNEAFRKEKWERAITAYTFALSAAKLADASEPVFAALHFNLGMSNNKAKHFMTAHEHFTEALKSKNLQLKALRNRAIALENLRLYSGAKRDLLEALNLVKKGDHAQFRPVIEQELARLEKKMEQERVRAEEKMEQERMEEEWRRREAPRARFFRRFEDDFFFDDHFFFFHQFFSDYAASALRPAPDLDQHYRTLGLEPGASEADVKTAFKTLALQHHPDKGGDAERFKEIRNAYGMLTGLLVMAKKKKPSANPQAKATATKAQNNGSVPTASAPSPSKPSTPASKGPASQTTQPPPARPPPKSASPSSSTKPPATATSQEPSEPGLKAAIESSLRYLEHGFVSEAFSELHSALHPSGPQISPDRLLRLGRASSLVYEAQSNVAGGKPTIGLSRLKEAEKLWPKKDSQYGGTPETLAAADRIRLAAHWWSKDYDKVYEVTSELLAAGDRRTSSVPLRMVACYETAHFDEAAESATLYLAHAAENDPLASERRVLANQILQIVRERNIGNEAFKQQKWERAITFYVKAVRIAEKAEGGQKSIAALYYNLGMAQLKAEHTEAATDYFTEALEHDSTHVKARRNRAIAYEKLDQLESAFYDLQAAIGYAARAKDKAALEALQRDRLRVDSKLVELEDDDEEEEEEEEEEPINWHGWEPDDDDYYGNEDDEDDYGHPYNCGCRHNAYADEYARIFEESLLRGRSSNTAQHYRTLGIEPGSTEVQVRTAFKALARQHHPDKGGDAEKFKEIRHAYGVLTGETQEGDASDCVVS
ncbi:hypothetical protein JCM10908_000027 [Rhodotorula pacifica]|uniref:uncharacterized protein n=1 Tax=Rhodotorula pacifica TaxID=1495444 RepID=UPI003181B767